MTTDEVLERIRQADALEYDGGPITAPSMFSAKSARPSLWRRESLHRPRCRFLPVR